MFLVGVADVIIVYAYNVYAYNDLNNASTKRRLRNFPRRFLFSYENIEQGIKEAIGNAEVSTENLRVVNEESWESVRDAVVGLIQNLTGTAAEEEVYRYIPERRVRIHACASTS